MADFELMMRAFGNHGEFHAVDEVFEEMLLQGVVPAIAACTSLRYARQGTCPAHTGSGWWSAWS